MKPPGGSEFEQIVEFTKFDRPSRLRMQIVEGPYPMTGILTFQPDQGRTQVSFAA